MPLVTAFRVLQYRRHPVPPFALRADISLNVPITLVVAERGVTVLAGLEVFVVTSAIHTLSSEAIWSKHPVPRFEPVPKFGSVPACPAICQGDPHGDSTSGAIHWAVVRDLTTPGGSRFIPLLAPPEAVVRCNGIPLATGIAALEHGDELKVAGQRFFFSDDTAPAVEAFGGEAPVACARCSRALHPGMPSVACPECLVAYHQDGTLPCWHDPPDVVSCALCPSNTDLSGESSFDPGEL